MTIIQRVRRAMACIGFYRPVRGDVVVDQYDGREKVVTFVAGRRVHATYMARGQAQDSLLLRTSVSFVR